MDSRASDDAARKVAAIIEAAPAVAGGRAKGRPAEKLVPLCASTWQDVPVPPRRWFWPQWIPDRVVTLLSGDGGVGKSTLALQIAAAAALGRDLFGTPIAPRRVLVISAEDDAAEVHRRLAAVLEGMGAEFGDMDDRLHVECPNAESSLLVRTDGAGKTLRTTPFFDRVRAFCRDEGVQLLIVDPAADVFGGNEIDRAHVTRFIRLLENIAREMDGAVLLLAHPSVAGLSNKSGISGSTAWRNAARSVVWFRRPEPEEATGGVPTRDQRVLERVKANLAPAEGVLRLVYRAGSFVLDGIEEAGRGSTLDGAVLGAAFCEALADALRAGQEPSPSLNSAAYAPRALKQSPPLRSFTVAQIERAMCEGLARGSLRIAHCGPPSRTRKVLVPVGFGRLPEERAISPAETGGEDDAK